MYAKYPVTSVLVDYAQTLRRRELKYTVEEFSDVFHHAKSWASNFLSNTLKDINAKDLWKLFLADYNCECLKQKKERIMELIADGIELHYLKPTATYDKMFGNKFPIEILKGEPYKVPSDLVNSGYKEESNELFSENNFSEEYRYVCVNFEDRYKIGNKQLGIIEKFIIKKIEKLMKPLSEFGLRTEYGLFAMYIMLKDVEVSTPLLERIKFICFDEDDRHPSRDSEWKHIYCNILNKNFTLKNVDYYQDENAVYFDNHKESMSEENLPTFNIRYDIEKMITTDRVCDDYFQLKLFDCVDGTVKLIDLFMILYYGNYIESKKKYPDEIFKKTCVELARYKIDSPFAKLKLIDIPEIDDNEIDTELFLLLKSINDFFRDKNKYDPTTDTYEIKEKYKDNKALMQFKANVGNCLEKFLNVVAIDFSFITKLSSSKEDELRKELEEVVNNFKKKNLK